MRPRDRPHQARLIMNLRPTPAVKLNPDNRARWLQLRPKCILTGWNWSHAGPGWRAVGNNQGVSRLVSLIMKISLATGAVLPFYDRLVNSSAAKERLCVWRSSLLYANARELCWPIAVMKYFKREWGLLCEREREQACSMHVMLYCCTYIHLCVLCTYHPPVY